ncbi:MAG: uncharacterized protein A8A55_2481, partial [Amphiamblys sp. WSBS2006]
MTGETDVGTICVKLQEIDRVLVELKEFLGEIQEQAVAIDKKAAEVREVCDKLARGLISGIRLHCPEARGASLDVLERDATWKNNVSATNNARARGGERRAAQARYLEEEKAASESTRLWANFTGTKDLKRHREQAQKEMESMLGTLKEAAESARQTTEVVGDEVQRRAQEQGARVQEAVGRCQRVLEKSCTELGKMREEHTEEGARLERAGNALDQTEMAANIAVNEHGVGIEELRGGLNDIRTSWAYVEGQLNEALDLGRSLEEKIAEEVEQRKGLANEGLRENRDLSAAIFAEEQAGHEQFRELEARTEAWAKRQEKELERLEWAIVEGKRLLKRAGDGIEAFARMKQTETGAVELERELAQELDSRRGDGQEWLSDKLGRKLEDLQRQADSFNQGLQRIAAERREAATTEEAEGSKGWKIERDIDTLLEETRGLVEVAKKENMVGDGFSVLVAQKKEEEAIVPAQETE